MTQKTFVRSAIALVLGFVMASVIFSLTAPVTYGQANRLNLVVLCSSCVGAGLPQEMANAWPYLLDQTSGAVWYYPGGIDSKKAPIYIGKLTEVGKPLTK